MPKVNFTQWMADLNSAIENHDFGPTPEGWSDYAWATERRGFCRRVANNPNNLKGFREYFDTGKTPLEVMNGWLTGVWLAGEKELCRPLQV